MAKRRNFKDQFKAKVALEELRGDKTGQEIAAKHQSQLPSRVSLNMDDIDACLGTFQISVWTYFALDEFG